MASGKILGISLADVEVGSGVDVAAHLKGKVWGAAHMELGGRSARVEEGVA